MKTVTATFAMPDWISQGLTSQAYERFGGVIRDSQTKHVVAMLRETAPNITQASTIFSQIGSSASILNLGVSVMGFAIVIKRLGEIEQRLKLVHEDVRKLNSKIDLFVYANFRAALDLTRDALTMNQRENKNNMAYLAINRFLEAQHTYVGYFETALEEDIQFANEYLSSLFLTHLAKARCYLELEEIETAARSLKESSKVFSVYLEKYVYKILPFLENEERDLLYNKYFQIFPPPIVTPPPKDYNNTLSDLFTIAAVTVTPFTPLGLVGGLLGNNSKKEDKPKLPKAWEKIEAMIETNRRFESYQTEIQAVSQLGISFHDWLKLTPSTEIKPDGAELMYIIPSQPLDLQPAI